MYYISCTNFNEDDFYKLIHFYIDMHDAQSFFQMNKSNFEINLYVTVILNWKRLDRPLFALSANSKQIACTEQYYYYHNH